MTQVIPVLFCVITITCAVATFLLGDVLFAAPPEEKLPELSKPQLHREKTKLELAVDQAAAMLLQDKLPPTEDGVRFALWLYGEKRDVAYLDIATKMARELVKTDPIMGTAALFWVAQAGGPTLEEGKASEVEVYRDQPKVGERAVMWLAGLAAKREPLPRRGPPGGITGNSERYEMSMAKWVTGLRFSMDSMQLAGHGWSDGFSSSMAKGFDKFWNANTSRFMDPAAHGPMINRDNGRTALVVWEAGLLSSNADFRKHGQQALESDLEEALQDTNAAAIAGLAAARMSHHHLQLAIIGDPQDSTITALRQAAYYLFEPNKIILNLDPARDAARMAELMYSPDAAPAMFVCVETLCSPPIKDPAELGKQVAEIKKLAAQVEQ